MPFDQADLWIAFNEKALALLRSGEDPFVLIAQVVKAAVSNWDEEESTTRAPRRGDRNTPPR